VIWPEGLRSDPSPLNRQRRRASLCPSDLLKRSRIYPAQRAKTVLPTWQGSQSCRAWFVARGILRFTTFRVPGLIFVLAHSVPGIIEKSMALEPITTAAARLTPRMGQTRNCLPALTQCWRDYSAPRLTTSIIAPTGEAGRNSGCKLSGSSGR
jgi:hypothetical protein